MIARVQTKINDAYAALILENKPVYLTTRLELKNERIKIRFHFLHNLLRFFGMRLASTKESEVAKILQKVAIEKKYKLDDEYKNKLVALVEKLKEKTLQSKNAKICCEFDTIKQRIGGKVIEINNKANAIIPEGDSIGSDKQGVSSDIVRDLDSLRINNADREEKLKKEEPEEEDTQDVEPKNVEQKLSDDNVTEQDSSKNSHGDPQVELKQKEVSYESVPEGHEGKRSPIDFATVAPLPPVPPAPPTPPPAPLPNVNSNNRMQKGTGNRASVAQKVRAQVPHLTIDLAAINEARARLNSSGSVRVKKALPQASSIENKPAASTPKNMKQGTARINTRLKGALLNLVTLEEFFDGKSSEEINRELSATDENGNTILHLAIKAKPRFIKDLIEYGADPSKTNNFGKIALQLYNDELGSYGDEEIRTLLTPQTV
ncbi:MULTISPECIES: ankyrin repeat domain-containing protein [Parachlamydia]|uniref:ankyrin repeat domain-containing protein n=1 Tax=Parachlamydia TaxID=83551 RepID=UPI0009B5B41B|nr:ankyrin repeat domain-containing protein [Parachlamydia acanthamoebae]